MSVRYSLDSLQVNGHRLFGWGWLLSEHAPARRIELRITHIDGEGSTLRCQQSGARTDLAEVFGDIAHAISAGFLIQGRVRSELDGCQAQLWAELTDGSELLLELPDFPQRYCTPSRPDHWQGRWRLAVDMLRQGQWLALLRRGWAMLHRRFSGLQRRVNGRLGLGSANRPVLVFDHAMGGGANHFRAERVVQWRTEGRDVLLVTPHLPTLGYEVTRLAAEGNRVARYPDLARCLASLQECPEIVINSLVSYDDPGLVLDWIEQHGRAAHLTFYLHDYHPVCPVWTLVDTSGRYCGIPDLATCRECLGNNDAPFLALLPPLDTGEWRQRWGRLLARVDHLRAFSNASVAVLRKAFPELAADRVQVEPHRTDYIQPDPVTPNLGLPLVIGVVGHINVYKGAAVVAEMAQIIEREALPARIVVIGSIDNVLPSAALTVTGAYHGGQLPAILRREAVGICWLPSICHETFSYVTAELMAHHMPLAVFDLGAPAERVRNYARGRIIAGISARAALDSLFQLREQLLADHDRNDASTLQGAP